jgi:hypothetical protein
MSRLGAGTKGEPNVRTLSYERSGFSAAMAFSVDPTVVAEFT